MYIISQKKTSRFLKKLINCHFKKIDLLFLRNKIMLQKFIVECSKVGFCQMNREINFVYICTN